MRNRADNIQTNYGRNLKKPGKLALKTWKRPGKRSELCLVQQGRRKDDQLLDLRPLMVVHIEQSQPCSTNWKQILNIEMKLFCSSDFFLGEVR